MFFFQAEDGIRDIGVTGVQTCALPISLDAQGRRQAGQLAAVLPVFGPLELFSAERVRCRQTLAPLAQRLGLELRDRKSVVQGKSVDLGGRRIIKKNILITSLVPPIDIARLIV